MRYYFQDGKCIIKSNDIIAGYQNMIETDVDIPVENAVLLSELFYDNRNIDYWRLLKTAENGMKFYISTETDIEVMPEFFIKPNQQTAEMVNLKKTGVELNETRGFEPYLFDVGYKKHVLTKEQLLQICRVIRDAFESAYHAYMTNTALINEAQTIEDLQTIVI